MSDEIPKMGVEYLNRVEPWGSEPKEDNGWISVDDRLPQRIDETVLVWGVDEEPMCACEVKRKKENGSVYCRDSNYEQLIGVTHWQPLPLPPMLKDQAS